MQREACLRMRLRWDSASLSSPDCLSHLKGYRRVERGDVERVPQHGRNVRLIGYVDDPRLDWDKSVGIDDGAQGVHTEFDVAELFFFLVEGELLPGERKVVFCHDVPV